MVTWSNIKKTLQRSFSGFQWIWAWVRLNVTFWDRTDSRSFFTGGSLFFEVWPILSWEIYSLKRLADSTRASLLGKFPHGSTMVPGLPPKWHQKTHPRDEWLLQPPAPPYVGGRRGFGKPTEGAFEAFLKWHYWGPAWRRHSRPLGPSWGQGQVTPKKITIGCFLRQEIYPPFTKKNHPWMFFCRFSKIWLKKGL